MRPIPVLSSALALGVALIPAAPPLPARAEAAVPPPAAAADPAISVAAVAERVLRDRVLASGYVAAVESVLVAPQIEGQAIEALLAEVGDDVTQGQVLARLSATALDLQRAQLTASLASARAQIAQAGAHLVEARAAAEEAQRVRARTEALRAQGAATQAAAEQAAASATAAEARVLVAIEAQNAARAQEALVQAQIANIDLQLARTEIKAPVAGRIVARNAQVGAIASAQARPMFEIVRDGALELRADVAEQDMQRLAPGQRATLRAVGLATPLSGTVRLVEPAIDAASRLGRVRIAVEAGENLRQGMFLEAEILVAERRALAVPVTAVGATAEGATVMRVEDNRVARVPVVTGIRDNGWVEIVSGLAPGQQVVAKAAAFVRDGDRITPVPAPAN